MNLNNLKAKDSLIYNAISNELNRQQNTLELIASENFTSETVMEATGSCLTNKYAEGYPNARYYGGCTFVDQIEDIARIRAMRLFGAEHVNVQPHSGSQANMAVYFALLKPYERIMSMDLIHGGHLTHGSMVNFSGKTYNFIHYGLNKNTGMIDYDELEKLAKIYKPKIILSGASAYPRKIDFKKIREICDKVDAIMMVDMSHIAGLVAAGIHENPVKYADVVTTTTHKTLRGPRGGLILCKEKYAKQIDKAVFPGIQGGPLMHVIAAKAVCFGEIIFNKYNFIQYQRRVVSNAQVLANELKKYNFKLISGGTDNHLILVDLRNKGITGLELEKRLEDVGITVNKNMIPFDTEKPTVTSGIRIGTAAVTTRGLKASDMKEIAKMINYIVEDYNKNRDIVSEMVQQLCNKYPIYEEVN